MQLISTHDESVKYKYTLTGNDSKDNLSPSHSRRVILRIKSISLPHFNCIIIIIIIIIIFSRDEFPAQKKISMKKIPKKEKKNERKKERNC